MAIVSISKIQHRRGLQENLPQLSSGEIGWSIDTRRLYIGNGSLAEGAPAIGNTEILTQYSDVLDALGSYTYEGSHTGTSATEASTRSLQAKLDDFANVRDWGATGDGATDDTAAIINAMEDLFQRGSTVSARRALYFPAGTYKVTGVIPIPTYAKIVGEGAQSTIIQQTDATEDCVARTSDSELQTGASIGLNSAVRPSFITVEGITFENTTAKTAFIVDKAQNCQFINCGFIGNKTTSPTSLTDSFSSVFLQGSTGFKTENIQFQNCWIGQSDYGVEADDDIRNVVFSGCRFTKCYIGLALGQNTTGSGASVIGPVGTIVKGSLFDSIFAQGLYVYSINKNGSMFNTYLDVGNNLNGTGNPATPVIEFEGAANFSIGDLFNRTEADNLTFPKIEQNGNSCFAFDAAHGLKYGRWRVRPGVSTTLTDNTGSATSTGLTVRTSEGSAIIDYRIARGSAEHIGRMFIAHDTTSGISTISQDFDENNGSVGVTFSVAQASGITTLSYTTTSTGNDATFYYSIRTLE